MVQKKYLKNMIGYFGNRMKFSIGRKRNEIWLGTWWISFDVLLMDSLKLLFFFLLKSELHLRQIRLNKNTFTFIVIKILKTIDNCMYLTMGFFLFIFLAVSSTVSKYIPKPEKCLSICRDFFENIKIK